MRALGKSFGLLTLSETASMMFDLIRGSGNSVATTVKLDSRNCSAEVWWCEGKQEWHWMLVWEDGTGPYSTHMHSGIAPTKVKARADITRTMIWIEDKWPTLEYFEGA
jgi:signal transduction histidine kinase